MRGADVCPPHEGPASSARRTRPYIGFRLGSRGCASASPRRPAAFAVDAKPQRSYGVHVRDVRDHTDWGGYV